MWHHVTPRGCMVASSHHVNSSTIEYAQHIFLAYMVLLGIRGGVGLLCQQGVPGAQRTSNSFRVYVRCLGGPWPRWLLDHNRHPWGRPGNSAKKGAQGVCEIRLPCLNQNPVFTCVHLLQAKSFSHFSHRSVVYWHILTSMENIMEINGMRRPIVVVVPCSSHVVPMFLSWRPWQETEFFHKAKMLMKWKCGRKFKGWRARCKLLPFSAALCMRLLGHRYRKARNFRGKLLCRFLFEMMVMSKHHETTA